MSFCIATRANLVIFYYNIICHIQDYARFSKKKIELPTELWQIKAAWQYQRIYFLFAHMQQCREDT